MQIIIICVVMDIYCVYIDAKINLYIQLEKKI